MAGMSAKASFKIEQLLKVEELFKSGEFGSRIRQFFLKFLARIINYKNQNLKKNIFMLAFEMGDFEIFSKNNQSQKSKPK